MMSRYFFGKIRPIKTKLALLVMAVLVFASCREEPQIWVVKSQDQNAGQYIESHSDEFSEFQRLVELTGIGPLLNIRGPFTVFLPSDEAMLAYYEEKKSELPGRFPGILP